MSQEIEEDRESGWCIEVIGREDYLSGNIWLTDSAKSQKLEISSPQCNFVPQKKDTNYINSDYF